MRKWQSDPLYKPHYRETGFLNVASSNASQVTKTVVTKYLASIKAHPAFNGLVCNINGAADVKSVVPSFSGPTEGWSGYFNKMAGYSHSANALRAVYEACVKLGVQFVLGSDKGEVTGLVYASGPFGEVCVGTKTRSGKIYRAEKVILALGASVGTLLPQIGSQITGSCWGVVHIQLTPEEAAQLRGIPVTNVLDLAFFFEPDQATNKLKFCHMGGGFTNFAGSRDGLSLPYPRLADSDFVPLEDENYVRRLLREVFPQFADRPLIDAHLCWFADTADSDYILDFVPGTNSSLAVLSGDSGHGFKMLPIIGDFVADLLRSGSQDNPKWRWKEASAIKQASSWRGNTTTQELAGIPRSRW